MASIATMPHLVALHKRREYDGLLILNDAIYIGVFEEDASQLNAIRVFCYGPNESTL
jgi:hypothetical protein